MIKMKKIIKNIKFLWGKTLAGLSLAKFLGAMITITILALVKYYISGSFHLDYSELGNNIAIGLLGWTLNTGIINILTEYLGIKGINFNLKQLLFGFDTLRIGEGFSNEKPKSKFYNAMDLDDEDITDKPLDKGKGIDKEVHPYYNGGIGTDRGDFGNEIKPLDKGKEVAPPTEPHLSTWKKVFPGLDPTSVFFPKKINPGPGFNVDGNEVPIRHEICRHIDYNTNILNQFKKMDLETAIEQRNNYLTKIQILDSKLSYAQDALNKVPTNPTTEYEFKLRNQILRDIETMSNDKVRSEARATLLNSRIQFIEIKMNNTKN
jgi:hypothetical protein